MQIKCVETIYSQGDSKFREDGFIVNHPFYVVIDGFSAPYNSKNPPKLYDGFSGGEMVRKKVLETFIKTNPDDDLADVILRANAAVAEFQSDIDIQRSDLLAGAAFIFVKVYPNKIEVIQGADCSAIWSGSGVIGAIQSQNFNYEIMVQKALKKYGDKFYEKRLGKMRLKNHNVHFAVLNGQPWVHECWQRYKYPIYNIPIPELLILLSDGLYPDLLPSMSKMIDDYHTGGLEKILNETRKTGSNAEATAVAIEFE